jgi:beta-lactamase regulating signal transducer with metallopeptidase domain
MEAFSVQLSPLFEWLVKTTIQGSVLIGLILLVKVILRGRLPIRWHYFFWLLLLVRLAAPRLPQSRFSIFNLVPESLQTGRVEILSILWLLGALVMACIVGARNFTLWKTVRRERPITDPQILDLLEDCKMEMGVQTIVGVVVSDRVKSPVLFGFVRPRLLLPQGILEAYGLEELRYIFIHELAHFKQRDIYLGWLMALLQIMHWFNPLMWFAFHRMRVDRELACDGLAVSMMQAHEPPRYGRTILNLFERFSQVSYVPSIAGILEDSSKLERRIKLIARFKKTSRKRSVGAVLVLAALACITLTDAYSAPPFIFGTPTNLGPTVNSSSDDDNPSISADGLSLYFQSRRSGGFGNADLWVTTRTSVSDPWEEPVNLGPTINSSSYDACPSISADSLELYFGSWRPGGFGDCDLWVTSRPTTDDPWGTPMNLGPTVNSSDAENLVEISADGLELFFGSKRPGGVGGWDIWVTTRTTINDDWGEPVNLGPTVNSSSGDGSPSISADSLSLFFDSSRPGGYGLWDIWVTTRATKDDYWGLPVNLGPVVNTVYGEAGPSISADGIQLYFSEWGGVFRPGGSGFIDLWQVEVDIVDNLTDKQDLKEP